jgi:hypothetical protein
MKVKEKAKIGVVISGSDTPNTNSFDFVVTRHDARRGQFVEVGTNEGTMVGVVTDIVRTNDYFANACAVKEFEYNTSLAEQFPVAEWEAGIAKVKALGVFTEDGKRMRVTAPPKPGTDVTPATRKTLQQFYEFDTDRGLFLGKVMFHDVDVRIGLSRLLQKHCCILAQSGFGKSYLVSVMLEELLQRPKEHGRIAVIVLDPHGEYTCFAEPGHGRHKDFSKATRVVEAQNIRIGMPNMSVEDIASIVPGLSRQQQRELKKVLDKLKQDARGGIGPFDLKKLMESIENNEAIQNKTKSVLLSWLYELETLKLFEKVDMPQSSALAMPGKLTIIDMSKLVDMKKKQIIVSYLAKRLFNERRQGRIPPFLLVIEEAHQFVPEKVAAEAAISRAIIRTIAREGRKFGSVLCLVSQRPVQLDTTTLSQCGTQIIMRVTNPYDLKHIGESSEGLDARSIDMIPGLQVGEALMVGEAVKYPLFFKVRQRYSQPSKHETTLEDAALNYEQEFEKRESELNRFLQ